LRIFISGGCKNGKSTLAKQLAISQNTGAGLYYVATMIPTGEDDVRRIARHRADREGDGFTTIEHPRNISRLLSVYPADGSFLVDSLTALMQNEMFRADFHDRDAYRRVIPQLTRVLDAFENIVIVSDFIYADAQRYDALTERYRESLAHIDRAVAAQCDTVIEVAYSCITVHKGELIT
jgi:adenosylcobinamide kinase/adenosylcobinamide-phosphate guanylyltransferase